MKDITLFVQISIPVTMSFDDDEEPPTPQFLHDAALENFIAHPALKNPSDLEMFVDSIGNSDLDVTTVAGPAANQRLIEATPVMIKALRVAFLHSCERSETRRKWTHANQIIHEQLKAALAAAELAPSEGAE